MAQMWTAKDKCPKCGQHGLRKVRCPECNQIGCGRSNCLGLPTGHCTVCKKHRKLKEL